MTAFRFARVALPSLALSLASLALPYAAAAGVEDDVFPQDAGPATRQMEERRRANEADWFRSPAAAGPQDFPSDEIHDAVVANARAANTRAIYRRVESAMHAAVRSAVRNFEQSPELKEAIAAEDRAHEAFHEARREALKDVLDNPRYQAMQDLREALSERIADRRQGGDTLIRVRPASSPSTTPATGATVHPVSTELLATPFVPRDGDDVLAIAMVKLRVGADVRRMEREALADNEKVKKAREDMLAASARVTGLRDGFDRGLRDNPDFKAAREGLEDARIARVTAAAYLQGADIAAGEALDFAYYLHRYDYYRYNNRDYGYGGYYRYGYPYYGASYVR